MRRLFSLLLLLTLLATPSFASAQGPTHTVAYGETLYSIARRYGVSPQALADANGITISSWVYAGQEMNIPGGVDEAQTTTSASPSPSGIYTVRAGDTLYSLSRKFGVSVYAIADANDIPPNGFLYSGWQLKIPDMAAPDKNATAQNAPVVTNNSPAQNKDASPSNANLSNAPVELPPRNATTTYLVQPGDTLYAIAVHFGVTIQAIAIATNLPSLFVYSGQQLVIPASPNANSAPAAAPAAAASGGLNLRIADVPLYKQQQTLTCEESAAAMALRGAVSEKQIVDAMPRSDNPFEGIRGETNFALIGGLTHYGTYAQGLQKGLAKLGHPSNAYYGQPYDKFKQSILDNLKQGRPVIWWTTWHESYERVQMVNISNGTSVPLTPYEHTVVIVAANDKGVTYNDPYDGTQRFTPWTSHQRVSAYFNNMALVVY